MPTVDSQFKSQASISFDRPPLVETVLGVQFNADFALKTHLLYQFIEHLGGDWKPPEEVPFLDFQHETFDPGTSWSPFLENSKIQIFPDLPPIRLRAKNKANDRMIQIQNGRLHYNWLKTENQEYPRYAKVRPEFDKVFTQWKEFLSSKSIALKENQWQITYINHIPKGTVWEHPSDWLRMFNQESNVQPCQGLTLESFSSRLTFEIAPKRGRLHVHAVRAQATNEKSEIKEVIRMDLTARGPVEGDQRNLDSGLNLGHDTIVNAFEGLTKNAKTHQYWGHKR